MFKIALSQIKTLPFDFETEVKKHVAAREAHRASEGEAAPAAVHPWVEAAIKRVQHPVEDKKPDDFAPDYEIIDDTPPPPTLDERKTTLANEATRAMHDALAVISPPLKRNLYAFQHNDARAAVAALEGQVARGVTTKAQFEMLAAPHKAALADHEDRDAKVQAVHRKLAQAHSDIDDLTEATIDGWKLEPF